MNNKNISIDILENHYEEIIHGLNELFNIYRVEFGMLRVKDVYSDVIIDKAIIYAISIKYDEYNVSNFGECFVSKEINDEEKYIIPDIFRDKLKKKIDFTIEDFAKKNKNIFLFDVNRNIGQLRILENFIIYQLKLEYKKNKDLEIDIANHSFSEFIKPLFKESIELRKDTYISNAIKYLIWYERNDSNIEICTEWLSDNDNGKDKFMLEDANKNIIYKQIDSFLNIYLNKKTDVDLEGDEQKEALLKTLEYAKEEINNIFEYSVYNTNENCNKLYKKNVDFFKKSEERITNSSKLSKFKIALEKAKMNYIMEYKGNNIYPFIFDLIVMRFSLIMMSVAYEEELKSVQLMIQKINKHEYKFIDKSRDEQYIHQDFKQIVEVLPKDYEDMTILLIKHYSEILEVEYDYVATVLRQLHFDTASKNKGEYKLPEFLINKDLFIEHDYFRMLSNSII